MGVYLSAPIVEKESVDEECNGFAYGASSMQGWRVSQEDAHNCIPEFIKESDTSLFAVYDGHGGAEVAKYCQLHFPEFVKSMIEKSTEDDLTDLIQSAFLQFDATLAEDDVVKRLKEIAGKDDENDEDDDPDVPVGKTEADLLKAEAVMPLEELLTRYKSDPTAQSSEVSSSGCSSSSLAAGSSSSSSSKQPSSSAPSSSSSSSHSINGPSQAEGESSNNNNKVDAIPEKNDSQQVGSSSGPCDSSSPTGGGSSKAENTDSWMGERASKTKALSEMAVAENLDDSSDDEDDDDDDDEDEEEELWEDCDDDDDDEDDENEDVDNDVPMMDMTNEEPGSDSGCTACVVFKQNNKLIVANAGDSRCVLSRNGTAVELSFDHKPEDDPERERIEKAGGKVTADGRVNGGLNLSRAFGDHVYKRNKELPSKEQMISALPDIKTIELESSDEFFVVACDGIWNFMSSQEVVDYVRERLSEPANRKKPSLINEELFDHCLAPNILGDGTGCDNMTCIIVVLDAAKELSSHQDKLGDKCKEPVDNNSVTNDNGKEDVTNDNADETDSIKRKCVTDNGEAGDAKKVKVDGGEA